MNPRIESLLKLPRYQRVLLLLALLAGIVAIFVYLLYLPLQTEYAELIQKEETLQNKLVSDRRIAANLPKFKAEHEKMLAQLDNALTELPNDKEIPKLLTSIAAAAKENGLEVLFFKPGGETPKGFYAEVPVSLKLVGSFHQVAMFFYDVGNLPRIVNLKDVSLGGSKSINGSLKLNVNCMATTFRFLSAEEQSKNKASKKGKKKK